ncbi:hypothetical protein [Cupriavidus pauculus]|uniref:hypothetical protein n=1 Tax=Cupriavidus pauculus TaxID=82633 RepID=UPI0012489BFF|nr:hypothetical protein [Cupriavidus pauculus]KAB0594710.1 hypothetical protein F7R19_29205 [Cupriavidus pauculus]UAK98487.1 hypothetical protein K8O84_10650 [Cupriavidus pauculus]
MNIRATASPILTLVVIGVLAAVVPTTTGASEALLLTAYAADGVIYPQKGVDECNQFERNVRRVQTYVNDFLYLHEEGVGDNTNGTRIYYEQATKIKWSISQYLNEWERSFKPAAYSGDSGTCQKLTQRAIDAINTFVKNQFPTDYAPFNP